MDESYGFKLIRQEDVSEINSTVKIYKHLKTGAELVSVINSDENKVFGITFRTPPSDSTGLPHIMEHSVFCGSRKYPVKEPFVELMKGSLNTFLNAMTYPDKTCYPVASTNLQDFYNLVDVYLDAVFFPLISPQTLMQEGWHYELNALDEEITFKGIVYNEMKGAYSSPDGVLYHESQMQLLPDTPYGYNSGGDPQQIINLTYPQFKQFHQQYYHPANARIWFYGDDDAQERLKILNEYLQNFDQINIDTLPGLQKPFQEPKRISIPYESEADSQDAKAYLTVNWLLPQGTDAELVLSLQILNHVLLGTPASPLRKILIESGLGEDLAGSGLTDEVRQMGFSVGMRGVETGNLDRVEVLILDSLDQIVAEGIDSRAIEASINTIEFNLRENNTGPYPRGLILMLRSLGTWLYGHDPLEPLKFEKPFNALKQKLTGNNRILETLTQNYLIDNPHRVTVTLLPDPELANQRLEKEQAILREYKNRLSFSQLEQLVSETMVLKEAQQTPDSAEDLAKIPMLHISDLERSVKKIPSTIISREPAVILHHDLFTSGILYLDLGFNLRTIPQNLIPYMRLFMRALLEMGTQKESFVELLQHIGRETGGIFPTLMTSENNDRSDVVAYLFLRAKVMAGKFNQLLSILSDILLLPNFNDRERFRQILLEEKSSFESGLIPSGHRVAGNRLKSQYSPSAYLTEQMSGIDYLFFIRSLIANYENQWNQIQSNLLTIRNRLIFQTNLIAKLTIDQPHWKDINPALQSFITTLPETGVERPVWKISPQPVNEGLTVPSQVNFVVKGGDIYALGYQENGSVNVIRQVLSTTWLWEKIRVQGGAYGGFSNFDRFSGIFSFLSYRDPNLLLTLDNYDATAAYLKNLELNDAELTKAIIGTIGDLDGYQLPDAKGYTAMLRYLLGVTEQDRQHVRDQVFAANKNDFEQFGEILQRLNNNASTVVLGSSEAINHANSQRSIFDKIRKVI